MSESKIPASNGQYKPLHLPLHLIDENLTLAEVYGPMRVGEPWPLPPRTAITPQPADTATQPPRRSRERERARVHRHTVKRQIEVSLTLPHIQKHGFTHPSNGHFLMLPPEYDVIQALEKKAVASVVLAV